MSNDKSSFVVYHDWEDAMDGLTDAQIGQVFRAMFAFDKTGEKYAGNDLEIRGLLRAIYVSMATNREKWETTRNKRRESGSKGGKQKAANLANASDATNTKPTEENQAKLPNVANVAVNDTVNVNVNDTVNDIVGVEKFTPLPQQDKPKQKRVVFSPPTLEEVTTYCRERGNSVDAQRWHSYYSSNGWMVGKNKMKDWKAAVRSWERNEYQRGGSVHEVRRTSERGSETDRWDGLEFETL